MKKIALLTLCLSSLSLYGSNKPSLGDLKRSIVTPSPTLDESFGSDDEELYREHDEKEAIKTKSATQINQALGKLSGRQRKPSK